MRLVIWILEGHYVWLVLFRSEFIIMIRHKIWVSTVYYLTPSSSFIRIWDRQNQRNSVPWHVNCSVTEFDVGSPAWFIEQRDVSTPTQKSSFPTRRVFPLLSRTSELSTLNFDLSSHWETSTSSWWVPAVPLADCFLPAPEKHHVYFSIFNVQTLSPLLPYNCHRFRVSILKFWVLLLWRKFNNYFSVCQCFYFFISFSNTHLLNDEMNVNSYIFANLKTTFSSNFHKNGRTWFL